MSRLLQPRLPLRRRTVCSMAYTIHCGQPWPHEVRAFHEIEYVLQNDHDWVIVTNSGAHEPETNETDILLIGRLGIIVVELKHWKGHITSHLNAPWTVRYEDGAEELRKNPLDQAREAMFKLRKLFTDFGIDGRDFFISYLVVTTHPESQLFASSPKVADLVTSLKKFRPGLYDHIRTHQRPINERNFGPDHIARLLNAREIDDKDINRALDYLHGKHRQSRMHPNIAVPAQASDGENSIVETKVTAEPLSQIAPSQLQAHVTTLASDQIIQDAAPVPTTVAENDLSREINNDFDHTINAIENISKNSLYLFAKPAKIIEHSTIQQTFSQGRSKSVQVEVRRSSTPRRPNYKN